MSMWIKIAIAAGLVLGFMLLRTIGKVSSAQAHAMVDGGALLLDVRTPSEFASAHVAGAVNIPVQELDGRLEELGDDPQRTIVVYCRSGVRSARAKRLLGAEGFSDVHDLGAMSRW